MIFSKLLRGKNPHLEIAKFSYPVPSGTKTYNDAIRWEFGWNILNSGKVAAIDVKISLEVQPEVDRVAKSYQFTMLEHITIMPEKMRNNIPPRVIMSQDLNATHFEVIRTIHHRSDNSLKVESEEVPERFPTEDETGHPLGYRFDLTFESPNLTEEDKRSWKYKVSFSGRESKFGEEIGRFGGTIPLLTSMD